MDLDLLKLLGQGGITAFSLGLVAYLLWKIGTRMIEAIDRIGQKFDEHTKADLAAHGAMGLQFIALRDETARLNAEVRRDLAVLSKQVDFALEWSERTPPPMTVDAIPRSRDRRDRDIPETEYSLTKSGRYRNPNRER